jgi:hypothetical protein
MPSARRVFGCSLVVVLAACQAPVAAVHRAAASAVPVAKAGSPAPSPVASASPLRVLQRPSGQVTELAGSVGMDAAYVVAAGQGRILSNNAGSVLALGGAGVVGNNGSGLISDHGAGALADGNAVAGFRLLADAPARGLLPASGALVKVTSLATGQPLTLGVDADGQPVTAVYSNARGAFKVFLPLSEAGNVLVQVTAPGATDERLKYDLVTDPKTVAVVDDDSDLNTRFVRTVFVSRMVTILAEPDAKALDTILASSDNTQNPVVKEALRGIVQDLSGAARQAGVPLSPADAKVQALAARLIDVIMASLGPPNQILITKLMAPDWPGAEVPALPAIGEALKDLREATAARLASDPTYFKTHVFDFKDGADMPINAPIDVVKASDPGAYLVREFLGKNVRNGFRNCDYVFKDLDVRTGKDGIKHSDRIESATYAMLGAITIALSDGGAAHDPVLKAMQDFAKAQGWQP